MYLSTWTKWHSLHIKLCHFLPVLYCVTFSQYESDTLGKRQTLYCAHGAFTELIKGGTNFICSILIFTHIAKVQSHYFICYSSICIWIQLMCYCFEAFPNIRAPMIIMRTSTQMKMTTSWMKITSQKGKQDSSSL